MKINYKVPVPVTLNCWKHHAGFIKNQINLLQKNRVSKVELRKLLLTIGESQMDLYLGILNPKEVANEIINNLKHFSINNCSNYDNWLSEDGKGYKQMGISDSSVWALRLGKQEERYIHIHPGRYSPVTLRVKAITLKSTIAVKVLTQKENYEHLDLKSINEVRKMFLKLPPLKSLSPSSGIGKILNIFTGINDSGLKKTLVRENIPH